MVPFLSIGLVNSFVTNHDRVATYAERTKYPYLLILAEKEVLVSNKASKSWHTATSSKDKQLKLIPNAFHELCKEPNNHLVFESILKFLQHRLKQDPKAFGAFNIKEVKEVVMVPAYRKKRFWILLLILYICIGLIVKIITKNKRHFLSWPSILVIARRSFAK